MTVLITPQVGAANSELINVSNIRFNISLLFRQEATLRLIGGALGAGEFVRLEYYDGTNWQTANTAGNLGNVLNEDYTVRTIYGRMIGMRVSKSVTANAIGVEVV